MWGFDDKQLLGILKESDIAFLPYTFLLHLRWISLKEEEVEI